jgi:hypothetical protein
VPGALWEAPAEPQGVGLWVIGAAIGSVAVVAAFVWFGWRVLRRRAAHTADHIRNAATILRLLFDVGSAIIKGFIAAGFISDPRTAATTTRALAFVILVVGGASFVVEVGVRLHRTFLSAAPAIVTRLEVVLHLIIIVVLELPFLIVVASGLAVDAIGYSVLSDACITTCGLAIGGRWAAASLASLPSSPPGSPPGSPTEPGGDSNNANVADVAVDAPAGAAMPSKPRSLQRKQQRSGPVQRVAALQRAARATAQALHLDGAPLKPDEVTAVLQEVRRRMGGGSLEGAGATMMIDNLIASVAAGVVDDGTGIAASSSTLDAHYTPALPTNGVAAVPSGVGRGLACPTADRPTTTAAWPVVASGVSSTSGAPARGKLRPPPLEGDGWGRPARGGVFGMSVDENFARTLNSAPSTPRAV